MSKNKKEYMVCVKWDVQKIYYVQANNEEEAQEIYHEGVSNPGQHESWEYPEILECQEVA